MSDGNDDDLEVYVYRGNKGEKVPETVEKLIVKEGVQVLPDSLCNEYERLREVSLPDGLIKIGDWSFCKCVNLLEISIGSTVQVIEAGAFEDCQRLKKVEFEYSKTSPHQQQTICQSVFQDCSELSRIKLSSSVNAVGAGIFEGCCALIEANLSTTCITEIASVAFRHCSSLQTVSLPNTVERIKDGAFYRCLELVTVIVPLDSKPIKIGYWSFGHCRRLVNLVLPKESTSAAEEDSFDQCELLHKCYGEDSSPIVAGLIERFANFPIHKMCYDHSPSTTVPKLRKYIADHQPVGDSLLDMFEMTPFHVLFSTIEPSIEVLDVLLDSLPNQILKHKDANGKRPVDYLINNWTDGSTSMVQKTLQKSMIGPLAHWGDTSWVETIQRKFQDIHVEDDQERRETLCNEVYAAFEHYENVQATSTLEMALWKWKLKSGWTSDGTKRQALDRDECRCLSGSDVVIPSIAAFLDIPRKVASD